MNSTAADPLPLLEGSSRQTSDPGVHRQGDRGRITRFPAATERIAVFDNDGTLWPENPMPFQAAFAIDELKRRVPAEPELAMHPMVQAALDGDIAKLWKASISTACCRSWRSPMPG